MKILIDTTVSKKATVSLFRGQKLITQKEGDSPLELIAKILKENQLTIKEVDFELKNEPGSYTGLKVGAAIVNALNFTLGKKEMVTPKY